MNACLAKVRQAVLEAKEELQQSQSHSAPERFSERHNSDNGVGLSGLLSLVRELKGLLRGSITVLEAYTAVLLFVLYKVKPAFTGAVVAPGTRVFITNIGVKSNEHAP